MSMKTTVRSAAARLTMSNDDVRALLHKDHVEALDLAQRMQAAKSPAVRKSLLQKLKPALTAHSRAEEKVVYDALLSVRSVESHDYGNEGFVEHSLVDELLKRLQKGDAASGIWKAEAKVLHEMLDHHISEEQRDVFSDLGEHFDAQQLVTMGKLFAARKAMLLKPKTPSRSKRRV
jgi:hemerythrin superfamily protein